MDGEKLRRRRISLSIYVMFFPGIFATFIPFVTFAGPGEIYIMPLSIGILAAGLSIWGMVGFVRYCRWRYRFIVFLAATPILLATLNGANRLLFILFN